MGREASVGSRIEELEVVGELAEDDNWKHVATLKGVATIWLTSQKPDELPIETLIANLIEAPIKLGADITIPKTLLATLVMLDC